MKLSSIHCPSKINRGNVGLASFEYACKIWYIYYSSVFICKSDSFTLDPHRANSFAHSVLIYFTNYALLTKAFSVVLWSFILMSLPTHNVSICLSLICSFRWRGRNSSIDHMTLKNIFLKYIKIV